MKYLILFTWTALILSVGCLNKQEEEPPAITVNPPASTSDNPSVDRDKKLKLVVQAPIPGTSTIKDQQPLNARYTLTADNPGKLLVRVRDPLLVTDLPSWINVKGSLSSDGLAQRVLELSSEDLATPLAIEARVVHFREPEEMIRVEFTLHRGDKTENWFNFYQCRPAMKTVRSSWSGRFNTDGDPVFIDSGETANLWMIRFGGTGNDLTRARAEVPLDKSDKQRVMIELGWKSDLDWTSELNGKPEVERTKKQGSTKGFKPAKRGCYEE